ncbi:MAG: polysaccharide biosynthesis C-terminal domain-containing protein [Spirochaetaceae bacterium]|jgi:Na+-driven multidrug efflux pump|nr:polysaccharide biosynthesis C-terminal domain-containing protein [Spirochaetaceae bacterium]
MAVAAPVMLQQLIMSLVSLIDNFMVAGLGDISMAAVNVSNQLNFIFIVLVNVVCASGGIYLAQFRGAGDSGGMQNAYRFKVILGLVVSALYFFCCHLIPGPMMAIMTMGNAAQEEIIAAGEQYIRLISFTLIPIALSSAIGTSYREIGRPKIPLLFSAAATLVNTFGNWILIYGNLGAPRLEVRGAAISTIIARLVELSLFILYSRRDRPPFFTRFREILRVKWAFVKNILVKSVMIFISELSWVGSETIVTALYNGRGGAETVAGMAAGWTLGNIFFLVFNGIHATTAVVIGGVLGAGRLDEARKRAEWIKGGAVIFGAAVAVLGAGFSVLVIPIAFMNLTSAARGIAFGMVSVILVYMPLWALLNAQFAISRAGGDAAMGMYADVSVNSLLFVPGAFLLAWKTGVGPVLMFAILKLSDIIKFFVARYFLNKEKWVKNLTRGP